MRIGIDIQQLLGRSRSGLYFYTSGLVDGFSQIVNGHSVTLFATGDPDPMDLERVRKEHATLPLRVFKQPGWPYRLRLRFHPLSRLDVFQYLTTHEVPVCDRRLNSFLVPDLTAHVCPQWHTDANRSHWNRLLDMVCQHADLVVTFSEHTRLEVEARLGISRERIAAIHLAAGHEFQPVTDQGVLSNGLQKWGLKPDGYILSVGTLEPRKNHRVLLRAFRRLIDRGDDGGRQLVLAGAKGWDYESIFHEITQLGLEQRVLHLGHADPLAVLYSGATLMAYPSLYEGFGLPPLEAMACGCPVISSSSSSLPEVVGEAGLLVDPEDETAWTDALATVIGDAAKRAEMHKTGVARAAEFSWRETARRTLVAYEMALLRRG